MSPRRSLRRALLPVLLVLALLAACGSDDGADPPSPPNPAIPRIDLDPERYFTDYRTATESGDMPSGGMTSGAAVDAEGGYPTAPPEPGIHDDNTFVNPGENLFVSVAEQPQSTFGLDVDTGSLMVGRTFIDHGETLPPADSVRVEEWVNALGSTQEAPTDSDLGVTLTGARSPFDDVEVLRVGVAAREVAPEDRPPANVTFVVDTSGSMDIRDRLGLVKSSLALLVLNLNDGDTISIVTFDNDSKVLLEPTPVEDSQTIVDAIDSLGPGGGTNLEAGLRQGYDQAAASYKDDGINAVVLASDGVANIGTTGPDALATEIRDRADDGIHLVTVGYGMGNYNDHLMEQVADQGDGFYAYVDTYEETERLFGDRLTSLLTVVAYDAKVQVDFADGPIEAYRLIGYENRALDPEDFDDDTVDAGEIGAGHRVTALYEVRLDPAASVWGEADVDPDPEAALGEVSVRYRSSATDEQVTVSEPITMDLFMEAFDSADPDFRLQVATAAFADVLRGSTTAAERGLTVEDAHRVASTAAGQLSDGSLADAAITPAEIVELMERAGALPAAPEPNQTCGPNDPAC